MTITITGLPLQGTLLDTTNIPVETAGVTGHITAATIKSYLSAGTLTSITAVSGSITGTLSSGSFSTGAIDATSIHTTSYATVDGVLTVGSTSSFGADISQTVGNISTLGNVIASGNVHASNFVSSGNVIVGNVNVSGQMTGTLRTTSNITSGNIIPSANVTYNIGSTTSWFNTLYTAAATHNTLTINNSLSAGMNNTANIGSLSTMFSNVHATTVVVNSGGLKPSSNNTSNIGSSGAWFNTIFGVASQALYADLAEKYTSDLMYAPGTVVVFGDLTEVTISTEANDRRVAGVVSTDPAYLMNGGIEGVAVALQGRVPCQVTGTVLRGDLMVTSAIPGVAMTNNDPKMGTVIGKALGSHTGDGVGVVEVVVGRI